MTQDLWAKMAHIAQAIEQGRYRYTIHGAQQQVARRVRRTELQEAIASGSIIEDYPAHRFGPCCLVLGRRAAGRPLHVLCSLRPTVDIITIYEPNADEWAADWRTRRQR